MTDFQALRDHVLARLGSPVPTLPGEHLRAPSSDWAYDRWEDFCDETDGEVDLEAVEAFTADLEAVRESDPAAFEAGRTMLLGSLPVFVELTDDAETDPPSAIRATPARGRLGANQKIARMRARVLERLGRPQGSLPGEGYSLRDSPALMQVRSLCEALEYQLDERNLDRVIEQLAALRLRDPQAFCFGRIELLRLLPVEV